MSTNEAASKAGLLNPNPRKGRMADEPREQRANQINELWITTAFVAGASFDDSLAMVVVGSKHRIA